jgi:small subunit ribosomal protein S8
MATISTDPIADMLTRIRNAIAVQKNEVKLPHSKMKEQVARVLKSKNLLESVEVIQLKDSVYKDLKLTINAADANARITSIQRISTPGRRLYARADKIPTVKNGRGFVLVSTSKGLMTGSEAKKLGIGGELICKVY